MHYLYLRDEKNTEIVFVARTPAEIKSRLLYYVLCYKHGLYVDKSSPVVRIEFNESSIAVHDKIQIHKFSNNQCREAVEIFYSAVEEQIIDDQSYYTVYNET